MKKRLLLLGLVIFVFGLSSCDLPFGNSDSGNKSADVVDSNVGDELVQVPNKSSYYEGKSCDDVVQELIDLGFTNVKKERVDDLITGFLTKEESVKNVSINGDKSFKSGKFDKNSEIIVYFHAFSNKCYDDHDVEKIEAIEATCTKKGNIEYYHCKRCGKYYSDSQYKNEVELIDTIVEPHHIVVIDPAVEPTLTTTGLSEGSHCEICHQVLKEQKVVNWEGSNTERAMAAELEKVFPSEYAKRAAVTAITNYFAEDVWLNDNEKDPTKFHTYSDTLNHPENYYFYITNEGTYSYLDDTTWHINKLKVKSYGYYTEHCISMDVKLDNSVYCTLNWIDSRDVKPEQKITYGYKFDPASNVSFDLIKDDRNKSDEDAIDYSGRLSISDAYNYLELYLAFNYPAYTATVHKIIGVHNQWQKWDGSWYIDVDVTLKDSSNNKISCRVQCEVNYDKTIGSFYIL